MTDHEDESWDQSDDDGYSDLSFMRTARTDKGPYPWQREYWWFAMWNWADWTVHGALLAILAGVAALIWWL
jgi:hypothetical protein